jgi:hypothetical protein
MENDNKYQIYAKEFVRNVPAEIMQYLIALFMREAAINLGCEVKDNTLEKTIYYIKKDYSYIPVSFVASAFIRGSLGQLGDGKGRLIPKHIHGWLNEISIEYSRIQSQEKRKESESTQNIAFDLIKYPIGKAIMQKLDWYKEGKLNGDDWDKVDLKALTEAIGRGEYISFNKFFKL